MLTVLGLFFPNLWSLQYQSTHISIHHFARGQRLHVWRDGAFAAWCPLCGQEGTGVKVCSSWWRCCGGSSVDLPWELRYQHGETILWKTGFFFEHVAIRYLELIWHEHSVGCTPVSPLMKYYSTLLFPQGSREQLAIAEFARSLLVIPKTLAVNAAQDSTDLVAKLRAFHNEAQVNPERKNLKWWVLPYCTSRETKVK